MRPLVHALLSTLLIVSDVTHAAAFGGVGPRANAGAGASDDDVRFRQNEAAWTRIAASVCTGCGGPAPRLEILRKRADITRLERQAGIGVPLAQPATSALRVEPGIAPSRPAEGRAAEVQAPVRTVAQIKSVETKPVETKPVETKSAASKPVLPTPPRQTRAVLRTRKAVRLARLRRGREHARLALVERRQRLAHAVRSAPPRRVEARPAIPAVPVTVRRAVRPLQVSALGAGVLSRPWPLPGAPTLPHRRHRVDVDVREVALERSRALLCRCTIR